ncbi:MULTISPECIES: homoserine O-succinyltransferase [unclassified Fusibacter]|uniref:homoserine O-succinyltransferase n=1 Tax=unclassified Fusibacter TaxID=2624464 RepID=UPI0010126A9B|nr:MULTISPECIES: homoserine O-succinyltransferase [unclassified Fusibacter]MCK8060440.1 homoserine O-succinyltransferase [Fusibacter sp. A2]NPE20271.1 homoserine O-succinyltransferase [Fusibacter sp. A1]RXV63477.1 homoserine O-succinyltransferase [Fusibacter sp. A1]
MPVIIPDRLPAAAVLKQENIFTMTRDRAMHQDIRPLRIGIVNLMPTKEVTETQLLRVLGNSPLQIEIVLIQLDTHTPKTTSAAHLERFYKSFSEVRHENFDGIVITGAPVEVYEYEKVTYWDELCEILDWSKHHGFGVFHICWGAQAALYRNYGIEKKTLPKKCFGVFEHEKLVEHSRLLRGFDDFFWIPQSRHTEITLEDVQKVDCLKVLAYSKESGVGLIISKDGKEVYATGHSEYDVMTLANEYFRDLNKGLTLDKPANYFRDNDDRKEPIVRWRGHGHLLFSNWLNYYVYQETPFDLCEVDL